MLRQKIICPDEANNPTPSPTDGVAVAGYSKIDMMLTMHGCAPQRRDGFLIKTLGRKWHMPLSRNDPGRWLVTPVALLGHIHNHG